jgi:hypothetical protein
LEDEPVVFRKGDVLFGKISGMCELFRTMEKHGVNVLLAENRPEDDE